MEYRCNRFFHRRYYKSNRNIVMPLYKRGITTPVSVANGGTGGATLGDAGVLIGNGTGAVQVTSAGTSGQVLTSNGAGVDPTFQAAGGGTPTMVNTTDFAASTRTVQDTGNSGTNGFTGSGLDQNTGSTSGSFARADINTGGSANRQLGSPTISFQVRALHDTATTGSFYCGLGGVTVDGTGHTFTVA